MNTQGVQLATLLSACATRPEALSWVDWEAAVDSALRQDVGPVLHARLKERGTEMPPLVAERLRESYVANAARNMRLLHERDRAIAALSAAGISSLPIKGASLAEPLYGDAALRPMADVDLWVRREDAGAARSVVESLGYTALSKTDRPPALQDALMGETQMAGPGGTLVELHWNLFPGEWLRHTTRIDQDAIWERSRQAGSGVMRQLAPEDAVIHLCVHLAVNHQMSGIGLRTLVDLDQARRKWTIDWALVSQRAREWRVACATWLVLDALAETFGDPDGSLPLRELAPAPYRQQTLRRFAPPHEIATGVELSRSSRRFLFLLLLVDRPADAAVLLWRALFPDRLWLTLRYGAPNASMWRAWQLRVGHLANIAGRRKL